MAVEGEAPKTKIGGQDWTCMATSRGGDFDKDEDEVKAVKFSLKVML